MATIRDLSALALRNRQPATVWRDQLLPAHFDGMPFHVETGTLESGRRIANHVFPKKDFPAPNYAEDMGREPYSFTVRGYIIVYPHDDPATPPGSLYQRDYRNARDNLKARLERGGPGVLQLPTFVNGKNGPIVVVCVRFRVTEEERLGGYAVFDMQFVERGVKPFSQRADPVQNLYQQAYALREQVRQIWAKETAPDQTANIRLGRYNPLMRRGTIKQIMGPYNPLRRFIGPPHIMRRFNPLKRLGKPPFPPIQGVTSPPKMVQGQPGGHSQF